MLETPAVYSSGGAKVAFRPHKPRTRFESGGCIHGGDHYTQHRVGGVSKDPSLLSGAVETGKLVIAGTEKALRSIVQEPGGRVDAVA